MAWILCLALLCGGVLVNAQNPHSCADVYRSNILAASGVFTIHNRQDQPFQVYCDFKKGYGYTYISPNVSVTVNIDDLYTDTTHVLIHDLRTDGSQYESRIEQIHAFRNTNLSIQFNSFHGYQPPLNSQMGPYVYVGLIPKALMKKGQTEGFKTNGHEATYRNCDNNGNSYFTFLFNSHHAAEKSYTPVPNVVTQLSQWDKGLPSSANLPQSFFSEFEFHFGGCGGYATILDFHSFKGAAVGLRFDITCPQPQAITHGTHSVSGLTAGSTLTYTCDIGNTVLSGDGSRVCAETGRWSGVAPYCGKFPCESGPCQNGGSCFEVEGSNYVCECREGFLGTHCEHVQ